MRLTNNQRIKVKIKIFRPLNDIFVLAYFQKRADISGQIIRDLVISSDKGSMAVPFAITSH